MNKEKRKYLVEFFDFLDGDVERSKDAVGSLRSGNEVLGSSLEGAKTGS